MKALLLAMLLTQAVTPQQAAAIVSGRLLSSDGRPASDVPVALSAVEGGPLLHPTQTDRAGRYRMEGVAPGRYYVVAGPFSRMTYLPGVVTRATASAITLNAGSAIEAAEFRMANGPGLIGLRVNGRVNGPTPAGQNPAVAFDLLGSDMVDRKTPVTVAPDGSFEVSDLRPGTYEVYVGNRVVAAFVLTDKDITDLALKVR